MLKTPHVFIGIKALGEQLRLNLRQPQPYRRDSFVVSACNAEAAARIDAWPRWTSGALALAGPAGAGKSHLAQAWAERAGARVVRLDEIDPETQGPLLIEDVGAAPLGEALFHLLNRTADPRQGLVLTGRARPADWPTALPDLRSRLNALAVVELHQPDDGVLSGALWRLFAERLIKPAPDLIAYLVTRIHRSVPAAAAMVERIEAAAATQGRPINRALARDLLARDDDTDETDA
jgi:chromosomal replication initiation ATPase DnaA